MTIQDTRALSARLESIAAPQGTLQGKARGMDIVSITSLAQRGQWRTAAMRSHSTPRLLWISKGQGRITLSGQTRGYGPNNLIYIPPNTLHGYEVGVHTYGSQITLPKALATDWPDHPLHLRLRDVAVQKELIALLENLERECQSDAPGADRAADHHAGLISVFAERQILLADDTTLPETSATRLVAAYTALIAQDISAANGVAGYAQTLKVTPTHLTRCCQQTCGRSALALLNDAVLFQARSKLTGSQDSIRAISQSLGFGSAAYFTRCFQSKTGLTPSEFRTRRKA